MAAFSCYNILLFSCVVSGLLLPEPVGSVKLSYSNNSDHRKDDDEFQREREADRVVHLPGQPVENVGFQHYAGYVKVRPQDVKALYYWFFEALNGVSDKPLVLWLNGGSSCVFLNFSKFSSLPRSISVLFFIYILIRPGGGGGGDGGGGGGAVGEVEEDWGR